MKIIFQVLLLTLLLSAIAKNSSAAFYTIEVSDSGFVQTFDTLMVGDTIQWVWVNGTHSTTSNGIPAGAMPWNEPIDDHHTSFTYIVQYGGTFNYISVPDAPLMGESFVAVYPVGISEPSTTVSNFFVSGNPGDNKIRFSFSLSKSSMVGFSLFDLSGREIYSAPPQIFPEGNQEESISVQSLPPGLYFLEMNIEGIQLSRKFILQ